MAVTEGTEPPAVEMPLSFESPESETIVRASYSPESMTLTIVFKRKGGMTSIYTYNPIELKVWTDFLEATSKGTFFGARIRPMYAGRAVK